MNVKTYQATTMAEALAAVKRDLGRDAIILQTRSFRKGRWLGLLGGRPMWEVTAAPNLNVLPKAPQGLYVAQTPPDVEAAIEEVILDQSPPKEPLILTPAIDPAPAPRAEDRNVLNQQMDDIRAMVEKLLATRSSTIDADMPAELQEVHVDLLQQDVEDRIALELVNQLRLDLTGRELSDWELIRGRLADLIAFRIPTTAAQAPAEAPQGRRVIAFIGPTGVGKTTTIAKLAANFRLKEGKRVGLLTIDTYRIAAVDQLRTYADIIEVPLQAVLTPAELQQAIQSMSQMDVVLIDTAGRSQNNPLRLNQLRGFLAAASPDEVHLVISATANQRCLRSAMDRFCPMGVNRIIMTKFDEAETFGVILTASTAGKGPLSYVTAGQEVPDDIAQADARRLAQAIVEGSMQPVRAG